MFDVSFGELTLIGLVALVVLGPERLPKVARTAGHLAGRLQRYVSDVKADINREMQLEELKKLQGQMQQSAQEVETSLSAEMQAVEAMLAAKNLDPQAIVIPPGETAAPSAPALARELPENPVLPLDATTGVAATTEASHGQQLELAIEPALEPAKRT